MIKGSSGKTGKRCSVSCVEGPCLSKWMFCNVIGLQLYVVADATSC